MNFSPVARVLGFRMVTAKKSTKRQAVLSIGTGEHGRQLVGEGSEGAGRRDRNELLSHGDFLFSEISKKATITTFMGGFISE